MDSIGSYGSGGFIDHAQRRQEMFAKIDSDGDGQFSLEEFEAAKPANAPADAPAAADIFSEIDADGDGFVSEDEFAAAPPPPPPPPGGGKGLLEEDTLSAILAALEEASTSVAEDDETTIESLTASEEENKFSEITEENILELIQQELENYRNSSYSQASSAYTDASGLSSILASQQQTLASL